MSWRGFAALAAGGRVLTIPPAALRPALLAYEALAGPAALLTWDEAERATAEMTTARGTADACARRHAAGAVRGLRQARPQTRSATAGRRAAQGRAASICAAT